MKRTLAHAMRRAARVLVGWSTKLDPPRVNCNISVSSRKRDGYDRAELLRRATYF